MSFGSSSYGSEAYGGLWVRQTTQSITYTLNGVLLKLGSNTFTLDSFIVLRFINLSLDGVLQKIVNVNISFTLDSFIVYRTSPCPADAAEDETTGSLYTTIDYLSW